ncbi:hypothetical protein ABK040_004493 [Willaertia magna]
MTENINAGDALSRYANIMANVSDAITYEFQMHPYRSLIDVAFVILIIWYLMNKRKTAQPQKLSKKQEDEIIEEWEPAPLIPEGENIDETINAQTINDKPYTLTSAGSVEFTIEGKEGKIVNFGTHNFLGFVGDKEIVEKCKETIKTYGVGSCGPRGFYGTIDVHLDLEKKAAEFMNQEGCILYSFGFCTISSVIPAFCKRGDVLVVDEGCNYAIKTGAHLSRSTIYYFKHNDMNDLERVLKKVTSDDKGREPNNRRFIIVEGVYENSADIAPLKEILELKNKYCFRIMVEDSFGMGVLGKTGRGTIEHFNLNPTDFEVICANLENAFASVGGVCMGSNVVVEHQRLSGAGYCFSASLPPYVSVAAIESIDRLETDPDSYLVPLHKNINLMKSTLLKKIPFDKMNLTLVHKEPCPILHIRLLDDHPVKQNFVALRKQLKELSANKSANKKQLKELEQRFYEERSKLQKKFQDVVAKCLEKKIAVVCPNYTHREISLPEPGIKISVSSKHSKEQIETCCNVLLSVLGEVFSQ